MSLVAPRERHGDAEVVQTGTSIRTVLRDLEFLRDSLHAPLAFCRRRNGFHYTAPGYALPLLRLTQGELVALFLPLAACLL